MHWIDKEFWLPEIERVLSKSTLLRGRCQKKSRKKLTSVSFAFTHTYTLEKLTLLLFPPSVHGKIWKMCKTQKKKKFHFITLFHVICGSFSPSFFTFPLCNFRYPNPSDRLIFVKVTGTFLGTNTNKILVFVIDDSLGMGGGVWWGRVVVQNLPSERKLPMGKVQKKVKKN